MSHPSQNASSPFLLFNILGFRNYNPIALVSTIPVAPSNPLISGQSLPLNLTSTCGTLPLHESGVYPIKMDEIQKLLPLFGFLGTICSAIVAALLCKSITEDLKTIVKEHDQEIVRLKLRLQNIELICKLTHTSDQVRAQLIEDSSNGH